MPNYIQPVAVDSPYDPYYHSYEDEIKGELKSKEASPYYESSIKSLKEPEIEIKTEEHAPVKTEPKKQEEISRTFFEWLRDLFTGRKAITPSEKTEETVEAVGTKGLTGIPELTSPDELFQNEKYLKSAKDINAHGKNMAENAKDEISSNEAEIFRMLISALKKQAQLRERNSLFAVEAIKDQQLSIQDIHTERMRLNAEIAALGKKGKLMGTISTYVNGGMIFLTGALVFSSAATFASGGAAFPLQGVVGTLTAALGLVQAGTTLYSGYTSHKLEKFQAESFGKNEENETVHYEIEINLDDMRKAMEQISSVYEALRKLLDAQYQARETFK